MAGFSSSSTATRRSQRVAATTVAARKAAEATLTTKTTNTAAAAASVSASAKAPGPPAAITSKTAASPSDPTAAPPTLPFASARAWEAWLETHHAEQAGVWMKLAKKASGIPSVTNDEAVDVALCWGWIDGQAGKKSQDEDDYYLKRFTPRRKGSMWSARNVAKVGALTAAGRMQPPGQKEVDAAVADGRWGRAYAGSSTIVVPDDFQAGLDGNEAAGLFWDTLKKGQRYSFLWRLETTKKADTRRRKVGMFVEMLAEHKTL